MPPQNSQTPSPMQPSFQTMTPEPSAPLPDGGKRSGRRWFIIGGVVLAVGIIGAGLYWQLGKSDRAASETNTQVIDNIAGKTLTAAEVANIDKEEAFFGYFLNAAQQQKLIVTTEDIKGNDPNDTNTQLNFYKVGFDFQTKQFVFAHDDVLPTMRGQDRCFSGTTAIRLNKTLRWIEQPITDTDPSCGKDGVYLYYIVDGFNTGGLTADQAQRFVGYLRQHAGLINVKSLELADHRGKQYLKFAVSLVPTAATGEYAGEYYGNQWLMWGFKETGLDPMTHPYDYRGAGGEGLEITYFVDPATKLPVYSETKTLPGKDKNGHNQAYDLFSHSRMTYQFGTADFDASTNNTEDITLDW